MSSVQAVRFTFLDCEKNAQFYLSHIFFLLFEIYLLYQLHLQALPPRPLGEGDLKLIKNLKLETFYTPFP